MGCQMDMLQVIKASQPPGPVPEGMKVSFSDNDSGSPASAGPVLSVGSFILWPMSYYDNRMSFGMCMYEPQGKVINMVEKPGSRYVYKITMEGAGGSGQVTFWGQGNTTVMMSLDDICGML